MDLHRINRRITSQQVRIVGDNVAQGVYPIEKALYMAEEAGLDLVEISSKSDPPVCKIIDYKKFLYGQKKRQKENLAKTAKIVLKELRFGPNTDNHDFNFKLKHAINFLQSGARLKAFVHFKGRSIVYKEKGEILLLKLAQELENYGIVEQMPRLEGQRMIMLVIPKKKK